MGREGSVEVIAGFSESSTPKIPRSRIIAVFGRLDSKNPAVLIHCVFFGDLDSRIPAVSESSTPNIPRSPSLGGIFGRLHSENPVVLRCQGISENLTFKIARTINKPRGFDDRCTRTFCSKEVHRQHVMTGTQEFLGWEGPPSSRYDRCTRIFCSTTSTLITWWQVHKEILFLKGIPSSCDDRSTRIFGLRGSALIIWWQIHKKFLFHNIHPHRVMTGAQESFVPKRSTCHHVMTGPQ
jgi:hypothetical protein